MPANVKLLLKLKHLTAFQNTCRRFSVSCQNLFKVAVLGASNQVGQPLSLLLKQNPGVSHLALYDSAHINGVAVDLSHIDTTSKVTGHQGTVHIKDCLTNSDIVIIPASVPRIKGMTRDDTFMTNASTVAELAKHCAKHSPNAFVCVLSNPINAMVPICTKMFKKLGVSERKIFGVTTLDLVRANSIIARIKNLDVSTVVVPVIGGYGEKTIVPLASSTSPDVDLSTEEIKAVTDEIQNAEKEILKAKAGKGTATLSLAYAGARFVNSLLIALKGDTQVLEYAYVKSNATLTTYFSSPLLLGANGIIENYGLGSLNDYERTLLDECIPELIKSINKGEEFAEHYHI